MKIFSRNNSWAWRLGLFIAAFGMVTIPASAEPVAEQSEPTAKPAPEAASSTRPGRTGRGGIDRSFTKPQPQATPAESQEPAPAPISAPTAPEQSSKSPEEPSVTEKAVEIPKPLLSAQEQERQQRRQRMEKQQRSAEEAELIRRETRYREIQQIQNQALQADESRRK